MCSTFSAIDANKYSVLFVVLQHQIYNDITKQLFNMTIAPRMLWSNAGWFSL